MDVTEFDHDYAAPDTELPRQSVTREMHELLERYRKALQFYADERNWINGRDLKGFPGFHGREIAARALLPPPTEGEEAGVAEWQYGERYGTGRRVFHAAPDAIAILPRSRESLSREEVERIGWLLEPEEQPSSASALNRALRDKLRAELDASTPEGG